MHKLDEKGTLNALLIPFILVIVILLGVTGFSIWAYTSRQDYKTNVDKKIEQAVEKAKTQTATEKDTEFVEKEKLPLRTYRGPEAYGSLVVKYPKTWSAYVIEGGNSTNPVDGFFNPGYVPGVDNSAVYALRVQVLPGSYSSELQRYSDFTTAGKVKIAPFKFPKVKGVVGSRINGEIDTGKQGSVILMPLRDKTLKVSTEATTFINDFNKNILPNLRFSP